MDRLDVECAGHPACLSALRASLRKASKPRPSMAKKPSTGTHTVPRHLYLSAGDWHLPTLSPPGALVNGAGFDNDGVLGGLKDPVDLHLRSFPTRFIGSWLTTLIGLLLISQRLCSFCSPSCARGAHHFYVLGREAYCRPVGQTR